MLKIIVDLDARIHSFFPKISQPYEIQTWLRYFNPWGSSDTIPKSFSEKNIFSS